jgi:SAM-dependent methyltransferase
MKYRPNPPLLALRRLVLSIERYGLRGAIADFYRRLFNSLRNRGFRDTLRRVVRKPPKSVEEAMPQRTHPFDLLHGIDTGGHIQGANLSAVSLSGLYNTEYGSISPAVLMQALSGLAIPYEDFSFIDIGCGKGRALLVAAQFPFRHLLGVEIAGELCDIARANVATNLNWAARISIVNEDATKIAYPDGPLLLFLYNPFFAPVFRRFLKNLERQLRRSPRPTYLLYALNPRFVKVLNSFPFLKELSDTGYSLSSDDDGTGPFIREQERVTLYCSEIAR